MKDRITFQHRMEYGALRTAQFLITLLPLKAASALVGGLLRVVFRLCWPAKRESISRMREVFGAEFPISECRRIARTAVWNLVMNFIELFHAGKMDLDYLGEHLEGALEAKARLDALIAKHGGVVLATPHMGNWDLAGIACSSFGIPLMAIARAQNNPLVEKWLRSNRLNFEAVDRRQPSGFVRIAHHLKGGGAFAILPDVRHNKPGVGTTVFGKPDVQLGKGVSKFARMGNVPILPVFMRRKDASHHTILLGEPIYPNLEADAVEDSKRLTQTVWDAFEVQIRATPEQWFWHNRRWLLTPLYTQTRKPGLLKRLLKRR